MSKIVITIDVDTDNQDDIGTIHEATAGAIEKMIGMTFVTAVVTSEVIE
jgi:hypothetical protein